MHTDKQALELAEFAENFDPAGTAPESTMDLRAIAESADAARANEVRLRELVQVARAHGRSWARIGIALGTSRQAAQERFGEKVRA